MTLPATVLWCVVWAVHPDEGVAYRGRLRFEELCLPASKELARGAHLLHAPP